MTDQPRLTDAARAAIEAAGKPEAQPIFRSGFCGGERCHCGKPADHKVEETIFDDDPMPVRHPLTAYVCHAHFRQIMGPAAR